MSDRTENYQAEALNELNQKYVTEADKLITEGLHCLNLDEKSKLKNIIDKVTNVFKKWDELIKEFNGAIPEEYHKMKFVFNKLQNEYRDMKKETVKEEVYSEETSSSNDDTSEYDDDESIEELEKKLEAEESGDPYFIPIEEKGFFSRNWGWIAGGAAALAVAAYYYFRDSDD